MTEPDDLPRLFDDPRDEYDVALDVVNIAAARLPINAYLSYARLLITQTERDMRETRTPNAREAAIGALETLIRDEYGINPRV